MSRPPRPTDLWWLPCAATVAFALLAAVPWQPQHATTGLDASWGVGLRLASLEGLAFGRDFVILLGPLGWVFLNTYHPGGYATLVGFWAFIAATMAVGTWLQLRAAGCSPWLATAVAMGLVCGVAVRPEALLYAVSALLLVRWFGGSWDWRADGWMLAVAAGLVPLVKFGHLLAACFVVGLITIDELRRNRSAWVAAASGSVFACGWLLCGQPLAGLPAFLRTSLELTFGYGDAMAHDAFPAGLMAGFATIAGLIVGRLAWPAIRRRDVGIGLFAAGAAGILLLIFKATFVRCDQAHLPIGGAVLTLLACLAAPPPADGGPCEPRRAVAWPLAALALLLTLAIRAEAYPDHPWRIPPIPGMLLRNPPAIIGFATGNRRLDAQAAAVAERVRSDYPFAAIEGPVDMVGYEQTALVAHGLDFRPRPVMHGNCAYTPALAELNAAHLRGPAAPRHLLLSAESIDDRLPWLDDSLARLEILRRYEPVEMRGRHLLLRLREQPRPVELAPLATHELPLAGDAFAPLPAEAPLWATVKLRPTALGRLRSLLYRAPILALDLRLADGTQRRFRLVPLMAEAGFLLSPLVETEAQFAGLAGATEPPDPPAQPVTGMRLTVKSAAPRWFYGETAEVKIFTVGAIR